MWLPQKVRRPGERRAADVCRCSHRSPAIHHLRNQGLSPPWSQNVRGLPGASNHADCSGRLLNYSSFLQVNKPGCLPAGSFAGCPAVHLSRKALWMPVPGQGLFFSLIPSVAVSVFDEV